MKHCRFILLLSISFLFFLPFISQAKGHSIENDILYYTNQFRKAHGLSPLKRVSFVDNIALDHSIDMARGRVGFGHRGFDTRTLLLKRKYGRYIATGENVAYGDITGKEVVDIWINSPPHRKNLLGNFSLVGIGVARNDQGILFFTQLFVRPPVN
ncbi:CAP domain-containing protein [Arachidicoccus sp.]|uniref:CAP domain-containing protein n=1 Tax=Arachidicoccus sp. TaxID=1872624 RepID=UPI003D1E1F47